MQEIAETFRLINLLKYLKIEDHISMIKMRSPILYNKLYNSFAKDLTIPIDNIHPPLPQVLLGGGEKPNYQNGHEYEISLLEHGNIKIIEYRNDNGIIYSFLGKKFDKNKSIIDDEAGSCIYMIQNGNNIHIDKINSNHMCVTNKNIRFSGSNLLELTLKFIDQIKNDKGIKQITLTDEAERFCDENRLSLSNFLFMVKGYGWYNNPNYGFSPAKQVSKDIYKIDENKIKKFENDRKKMLNMTVKESKIASIITSKISKETREKNVKSLKHFLQFLDGKDNNKVTFIIQNYLKLDNFDKRCMALWLIINRFFKEHDFSSYMGKVYIKFI